GRVAPLPPPRPRREIPCRLRRGIRRRGRRGRAHALSLANRERVRRALGRVGARGVPRPPPHRQRGAPAPGPGPTDTDPRRPRRSVRPGQAAGCARRADPRVRSRGGI
ncbi:MAG: hypothetical protein AVDCRST_MAG18-5042, partial [uncultured Thermomicrobiales bacterium]